MFVPHDASKDYFVTTNVHNKDIRKGDDSPIIPRKYFLRTELDPISLFLNFLEHFRYTIHYFNRRLVNRLLFALVAIDFDDTEQKQQSTDAYCQFFSDSWKMSLFDVNTRKFMTWKQLRDEVKDALVLKQWYID